MIINKRWELKNNFDSEVVNNLSKELNIDVSLARILVQRNIKTYAEAKTFFRPDFSHLHNPFLMHGMDQAVKRVIKALTQNQSILIYGDYDVDGTCSAAMLYLFLLKLGGNVSIFIPNRLKEGYGISEQGIDEAERKECKLLISVDCGITAIEEVEYARQKGIDVIICDHHQPAEVLPKAVAVLDPLIENCKYPYKHLSGCGVAFKLLQAICDSVGMKEEPKNYLDFVAIAAAADIVHLTDENRILVKDGLEQLNANPRPGFKALIERAGMKIGHLSSTQVVFGLAPRINAVGRLGDAQRAIDLLISDDFEKANEFAEILERENKKRKLIDEETLFEAEEELRNNPDFNSTTSIILHKEDWHPGVIGIVASRLVEKFYRPTIMLTSLDGVIKGSARSISGFNIYDALKRCEHLILQFGGHQAAAGVSIEPANFEQFKIEFEKIASAELDELKLTPSILIDSEVEFDAIKPKFVRILEQFAPFGPNNMRPVFLTRNVELFNNPRIVGNNHISLKVRKNGSQVFDVIGFDLGHLLEMIKNPQAKLDLVYSIETIVREGTQIPQIRLRDVKISTQQ